MSGFHASDAHRHVVTTVSMRLANGPGDTIPVAAELRYTTRDPYAVRATFTRPRHSPVVWVFARELLMVGASAHAGSGDVQVYPLDCDVIFELSSPEGSARLAASAADIRRFTDSMRELVAPGDEVTFVDIDAELERLEPTAFARDGASPRTVG